MKKVLFVAGARPNFMKIASLLREVKSYKDLKAVVIHTGQHYDYEMSESFFRDLEIQEPDYFLEVGSGSHAEQTAKTMTRFEKVCMKEKPDLVVVVGDVNSTFAASVTAAKLNIKVAHVEAGLRSFDMGMPEEVNRIITDKMSDLLFVTEKSGLKNLKREGIESRKVFFVGNTMIDSLVFGLKRLKKFNRSNAYRDKFHDYGVVTLHRPSNVDNKTQLKALVNSINKISKKVPVVFPIHPRTKKNIKQFKLKLDKNVHVIKPLGYLEFLQLYKDSRFVLTDSGGIQEETTYLKLPCFTLRENTERPVTITSGTNVLVGKNVYKLPEIVETAMKRSAKKTSIPKFWDGKAAERIIKIINKSI